MLNADDNLNNIYSVTEITREIKDTLELGVPPIWVQGEISNYVHHGSGHMYFSLKDENAQISCVMWKSRNAALPFVPMNGKTINAFGEIKVYEKRGFYQLDIQKMAPLGIGELQLAFEALKNKLFEQGLFDESAKKPIPKMPQNIGIITSQTGAAIRDILSGLNERFPGVQKVLRPTRVQGEGAAQDIAAAIYEFNQLDTVDVIILGRGGGSLEDLWAFNEEVVARAIFESAIPIISAVGHQVDYTISDFVADERAATPSAAAALAVPDRDELKRKLQTDFSRCIMSLQQAISSRQEKLSHLSSAYAFRRPLDSLQQNRQRIDDLMQSITVDCKQKFRQSQEKLDAQKKRIFSLHPKSILQRGYAVVQHKYKKSLVRQASQLENDDDVRIYFAHGVAEGRILEIDPAGDISSII